MKKFGTGYINSIINTARTAGFEVVTIDCQFYDTHDFIGIPYIKDGETVFSVPLWVDTIINDNIKDVNTVIIFENVARASNNVKDIIKNMVTFNKCGSFILPERTIYVIN